MSERACSICAIPMHLDFMPIQFQSCKKYFHINENRYTSMCWGCYTTCRNNPEVAIKYMGLKYQFDKLKTNSETLNNDIENLKENNKNDDIVFSLSGDSSYMYSDNNIFSKYKTEKVKINWMKTPRNISFPEVVIINST